jgi:formylglycine-generating enzyme required for sulfatase activity
MSGRGLLLVIVLLLALANPALAERRIALVIGNDVYRNLSDNEQLHNAVNDARAVKATLESLGFEVIAGENLNRASLVERLSDFGARLQQGDIAFFFYAGHGVSLNGANYILPSDISAPRSTGRDEEERLADLAVAEIRVIDRIKGAGARVAVVVLDACRDNPLAPPGGRSIGAPRGLTPPPETRGVLSIYSAGVGQQALDRLNDADAASNSVFTRVFVRKLKTPGLGLRAAAFETQGEVASLAASSGQEQVPGVYSQIIGEDVYLAGRAATVAPPPVADTQQAEFDVAMQAGTIAALDSFLGKYPGGPLANTARRERDRLAVSASALSAPVQQEVAAVTPAPPVASSPCGVMTLASLSSRSPAPLSRQEECALKAKDEFRECETCPPMVVVPAGSFTMGSPASEEGRHHQEGPQHDVKIAKPFAVGKFQVTVDEFNRFVMETGYYAGSSCYSWNGAEWEKTRGLSWRSPGFSQTGSHPAACLSWNDATAYAAWLSKKTGEPYRLLTEAEWEYAARGRTGPGSYPRYFFGDAEKQMCSYGNGADESMKQEVSVSSSWLVFPCSDGYAYTSPVGSFAPNAFGLYDMLGNVWQFVEDCYHDSYSGAPKDGSAWITGDCSQRVRRGGSWYYGPDYLRAAHRYAHSPVNRSAVNGFRLARTLTP